MKLRREQDLPSGSNMERNENCEASAVLERQDKPSVWSGTGVTVHKYLELCNQMGDFDKALAAMDAKDYEMLNRIDVPALPIGQPGAYKAEMTLTYNPDTGDVASYDHDPRKENPELSKTHLITRADLLAISKDGTTVYVGDYKTGYRKVPPARVNFQIGSAALIGARLYGASKANVEIIYVHESDEPFYNKATLDIFDLDAIEERMCALAKKVRTLRHNLDVSEGRQGVPSRMGSWCQYCPSFAYCPAQIRLLNALAHDPLLVMSEIESHISREKAAIAYEKLQAVKRVLKPVEEHLENFAREFPIDLPDGTRYGLASSSKEYVDGEQAYLVMKEIFGIDIAEKAVTKDASKTSIKRAVTPLKEGRKRTIQGMLEEVLVKLREKPGGVEMKTSIKVRVHNPKRS